MNYAKCFYGLNTGVYVLLMLIAFHSVSVYAVAEEHIRKGILMYLPLDVDDVPITVLEAQDILRVLPRVNGNLDIRGRVDAEALQVIFASGKLRAFSILEGVFIKEDGSFDDQAFDKLLENLRTTRLTHFRIWDFNAEHTNRIIEAILSNPHRTIANLEVYNCLLTQGAIPRIMELNLETLSLERSGGITTEDVVAIVTAYLKDTSRLKSLNLFACAINPEDAQILIGALRDKAQLSGSLVLAGEKELALVKNLMLPRGMLTMEQSEEAGLKVLPSICLGAFGGMQVTQQMLVNLLRNLQLTDVYSPCYTQEAMFTDYLSYPDGGVAQVRHCLGGMDKFLSLVITRNRLIELLLRRDVMRRNVEALHAVFAHNPQVNGHFTLLDPPREEESYPIQLPSYLPTIIGAYNTEDDREYYRVLMLADENALYHLPLYQIRIINQIREEEREVIIEGLRLARGIGVDIDGVTMLRARERLLQHMRPLDIKIILFLKSGAGVYGMIKSVLDLGGKE